MTWIWDTWPHGQHVTRLTSIQTKQRKFHLNKFKLSDWRHNFYGFFFVEIFSKMKIGLNSRFFLNYPQKQTKNHLFIPVSFTMAHGHHFLKVLPVRGEMDHETHKSSMEPPRGLFVCLHTRPESSSFVLMELCVLCMPFYTRLCTARGFSQLFRQRFSYHLLDFS